MAKINMKDKKENYIYPSRFGSHKSMVIEEINNKYVKCKDEHGEYITERFRLDNGLADPNRYTQKRIEYMCYNKSEN